MAMNNIFLGGSDPLLGNVPSYQRGSVEDELARIAAMQQQLDQKKMEIENAKLNMNQAAQSKTPVWDEIDKIVGEMSDSEIDFVNSNADFAKSNNAVIKELVHTRLVLSKRPNTIHNAANSDNECGEHTDTNKRLSAKFPKGSKKLACIRQRHNKKR